MVKRKGAPLSQRCLPSFVTQTTISKAVFQKRERPPLNCPLAWKKQDLYPNLAPRGAMQAPGWLSSSQDRGPLLSTWTLGPVRGAFSSLSGNKPEAALGGSGTLLQGQAEEPHDRGRSHDCHARLARC